MNIGILILMIIGGGVGVLSSLYIALSFPAVIVWKIYRKIRYGYKLTYQLYELLFYDSVQILFDLIHFGQDLFLLFVEQQFLIVLIILVTVIFL